MGYGHGMGCRDYRGKGYERWYRLKKQRSYDVIRVVEKVGKLFKAKGSQWIDSDWDCIKSS